MKHQSKKIPLVSRSSVGHVQKTRVRFASFDTELNFAYYHSMDVWQKAELVLRKQLKKIKVEEKVKSK